MTLQVNLEALKEGDLPFVGEIPAEKLDIIEDDELIRSVHPLTYNLEASLLEDALLVRGRLDMPLDCECARCLQPFVHTVTLPEWTAHLPLTGEDAVEIKEEVVDLTPVLREDILLGFPRHPLCAPDCAGLASKTNGDAATADPEESPWARLDEWKSD
ncbi:MAG: hypothetical protein CMO66_04625 [Verrucomicrobiales bacterium]|nr:hypothetical protein [Verrucomicrobiales bacterium]|tara:strand:- start:733 stop:1206 length:474 start_codon:yes stop_codon:yes gene_type:complete